MLFIKKLFEKKMKQVFLISICCNVQIKLEFNFLISISRFRLGFS